MPLEAEMETFRRKLHELLGVPANRGQYALIHGGQVIGCWPTWEEAADAGYNLFGLQPFLVKQVVEYDKPLYFSRNVGQCRT